MHSANPIGNSLDSKEVNMANMDADAFNALDERFALRLKERDKSVLTDIDREYIPRLYKLLMRYEGSLLRAEDIDEIAQDVLLKVWHGFSQDGGKKKLRNFIFDQAKWMAIDLIRKRTRERANCDRFMHEPSGVLPQRHSSPPADITSEEMATAESRVLTAVDAVVVGLPDRQRTAFRRRFHGKDPASWARDLEKETGKSASYWRKASDDALRSIRKTLTQRGLIKREGSRYEVA